MIDNNHQPPGGFSFDLRLCFDPPASGSKHNRIDGKNRSCGSGFPFAFASGSAFNMPSKAIRLPFRFRHPEPHWLSAIAVRINICAPETPQIVRLVSCIKVPMRRA
jgi:hypothetical protein